MRYEKVAKLKPFNFQEKLHKIKYGLDVYVGTLMTKLIGKMEHDEKSDLTLA